MKKYYAAIDLKSFYASVECVERGLDPLKYNLVVADPERTEKTICLAVSPSLKAFGVPSRPRLFEVMSVVAGVNAERRRRAGLTSLRGSSVMADELNLRPDLSVDYIIAPPRMALYVDYSTRIYSVYLKYFAPEDIFVYSIDEVFIDVSRYLKTYRTTPRELISRVIREVYDTTGITAAAGIGENLYLAKVAMDILAKRTEEDENGVRVASLDVLEYRRLLWEHRPLTDFWRVGIGYAKKLEAYGIYTMGDIALMSLRNEDLLYKLFGVNAELLIDHAWGIEPCSMEDIRAYKPRNTSISVGQVLQGPYEYDKARLITREMCDSIALDIVERAVVSNQAVLTVGYDIDNRSYTGEYTLDRYGRAIPKHAHGTVNLPMHTSSREELCEAVLSLFERIVDKRLYVRRINITLCNLLTEEEARKIEEKPFEQLNFFTDYDKREKEREDKEKIRERERRQMRALIKIKKKYGSNAILRGMNFEDGATGKERNMQIGGHRA